MKTNNSKCLQDHLEQVSDGRRRFENAFQAVARMILDTPDGIEKVVVNGKSIYDFTIFRKGRKHAIGMYDKKRTSRTSSNIRNPGPGKHASMISITILPPSFPAEQRQI
jgi:hypothetical protein